MAFFFLNFLAKAIGPQIYVPIKQSLPIVFKYLWNIPTLQIILNMRFKVTLGDS